MKKKTYFKKEFSRGMAIAELQNNVKHLAQAVKFVSFTHKEKDVLYKTVKLNEEVGELCNDILSVLSLQRKAKLKMFDKRNLYEEFADILITVSQLANSMDVNLQRAIRDKLKKIKTRSQQEDEDEISLKE